MKKLSMFFSTTVLAIALLLSGHLAQAAGNYTQTIILNPGWNVVSTPRILDSHTFSSPDTDYSIYVLNPASVSGWSTMADLGQTEFTPLYGYFINNTTASNQTLTFNYTQNPDPNQRLFERTFPQAGWYSFGPADPTDMKAKCDSLTNTGNPTPILQSLSGDYNQVLDFTAGESTISAQIGDTWSSAIPSDINSLSDFRELKSYGIYINTPGAEYNGFQNTDPVVDCAQLPTSVSGSVSVQSDPAFTATQFTPNSSQVTLGEWNMTASNENMEVNNLQVVLNYSGVATSGEGFNNLSLYVNGSAVGSSQSAILTSNATSTTYTFGTTNLFTIPIGQTVTIALKGDSALNMNTGVTGVRADLVIPANSMQGMTTFTNSPSSDQTYVGTTLSLASSAPTLTKNTAYTNQTISPNQSSQEIGSYTIQASSIDGVRVNQLTVGLSGTLNGNSPATGLTGLYLAISYPGGSATTTPVNPSASNTFTLNNVTIPANQTATVNVMANVSNSVSGTVITSLSGIGQGLTSNQSVTLSSATGQTITVFNGMINTPTLQTSSPVASFVIGATNNQPAATFNFVASGGSATIQELDFMIVTSGGAPAIPVTSVTVGGVTAPIVGATSTVTGLNISVPTSFGGVDVPVTVNYAAVGNNGIPSNEIFTVNLTRVKYLSGSSTKIIAPSVPSNSFDLVASAPTVNLSSVSNVLTAGTVVIAQVTVSANSAGNIVIDNLPISISTNNATITSSTVLAVDATTGVTAGTLPNFAVNSNNSATGSIAFSTDNSIAAGTSKTYNIEVSVSNVGSSVNGTPSISFGLGSASSLTFKDVNGNLDNIPGAVGNNTYIINYPTTTVSVHN